MTLQQVNDLLNALLRGRCKGCSNRHGSALDFISFGREAAWMCTDCWNHWLLCHSALTQEDSAEYIQRSVRKDFPNAAEALINRQRRSREESS